MDTEERLYTYRAIAGISMGGGLAHIALSNPDRYDFVGILGAPLVDLKAFARMIRRNWMQGFCSLEELENRMAEGLSSTLPMLSAVTTTPMQTIRCLRPSCRYYRPNATPRRTS